MLRAPLLQGEGAEPSSIRLRVLSPGGGVQSRHMAFRAAGLHYIRCLLETRRCLDLR